MKELTVKQIREYARCATTYELFDLFDEYRERYGRYDRRTSAIVFEIESRGYDVDPVLTAADLNDYMYGI